MKMVVGNNMAYKIVVGKFEVVENSNLGFL